MHKGSSVFLVDFQTPETVLHLAPEKPHLTFLCNIVHIKTVYIRDIKYTNKAYRTMNVTT